MAKSPIRVLVVEDFESFRAFVISTLAQHPELQVIRELSDGLEAVSVARELQPDLILLDIGLPSLNGIAAARRIREHSPQSKILFVSGALCSDVVEEAFSIGAVGYLVKADAGRQLLVAIGAVLQGKTFLSSSLSGLHVNHTATSMMPPAHGQNQSSLHSGRRTGRLLGATKPCFIPTIGSFWISCRDSSGPL